MGNRKMKTKSRINYDFLKTMEMIFNSVGKEIELLISYWKGWTSWILFTVGNVDRDIGRYSGRYSGRHSVDTRSTLGR